MSGPALIERRTDKAGSYDEHWMVEPPSMDEAYRVLDDSWNDDYSVRTIYAWKSEMRLRLP